MRRFPNRPIKSVSESNFLLNLIRSPDKMQPKIRGIQRVNITMPFRAISAILLVGFLIGFAAVPLARMLTDETPQIEQHPLKDRPNASASLR